MVRLSSTIFVPARTACRTSSSHTNSAGRPETPEVAREGEGELDPDIGPGTAIPREARNWSIRRVRESALSPGKAGAAAPRHG